LDARKNIDIENIVQIDDEGKRLYFKALSASACIRCSASATLQIDGTSQEVFPQAHPIAKWIAVAHNDARVAKAFDLISADFNSLHSLYKILEVMEEDNFKPIMRGGRYKKMVGNFTHTADCYQTTGIDARHAKDLKHPPKNPMTRPEAKSFIIMLLQEWLREKETELNKR